MSLSHNSKYYEKKTKKESSGKWIPFTDAVWFQDFKKSLQDQSELSITGHIDSTNDAVQRGMPATE
ncbi:hypothetical protein DPMN_003020 [Dreissena polymorpha]|uniref:Uncharacterized protein n=1 Tax=Dreissena polymorpha TaxID=45954 RepID=A0A9D4RS97_DREPO|nr:hypothetical protein DPMN_003020 [Dreissena polymorpha]